MADGARAVVTGIGFAGGAPADGSAATATKEAPVIPANIRASMIEALSAKAPAPAQPPAAAPPAPVAPAARPAPLASSEPASFAATVMRELDAPPVTPPAAPADPAAPAAAAPARDLTQLIESQSRTADAIAELVQSFRERDAAAGKTTTEADQFEELRTDHPKLADLFVKQQAQIESLSRQVSERGATQDARAVDEYVSGSIADVKRTHPGFTKEDAVRVATWMRAPENHEKWVGTYTFRDVANRVIGYDGMDARKFAGASPEPPKGVTPAPKQPSATVVDTTSPGTGGAPPAPTVAPSVRVAVRQMFQAHPNAFGKHT